MRPRDPENGDDDAGPVIRMGLGAVRMIGDDLADKIVDERVANGPYADMADLARRVQLTRAQIEALATAGAFDCFALARRAALWAAGAVAGERPDRLPGTTVGADARRRCRAWTPLELAVADVWATGLSPDTFPTEFLRGHLDELGARAGSPRCPKRTTSTRILVGGAVTHRQRPATAGGVTFINLEDETGMINVVCSPGLWARYRRVARNSSALLVRGMVESAEGVTSILADQLEPLDLSIPAKSRDFR